MQNLPTKSYTSSTSLLAVEVFFVFHLIFRCTLHLLTKLKTYELKKESMTHQIQNSIQHCKLQAFTDVCMLYRLHAYRALHNLNTKHRQLNSILFVKCYLQIAIDTVKKKSLSKVKYLFKNLDQLYSG